MTSLGRLSWAAAAGLALEHRVHGASAEHRGDTRLHDLPHRFDKIGARIVALSLALAGCRGAVAPVAAPAAMATLVAAKSSEARTAGDDVGFLGIVIAPATVDVTSQLEGRLLAIAVRAGDRVSSGAILAKLDSRSARHELAIAEADLAAAATERQQAKLELAQAEERVLRRQSVVELPTATVRTVSDEELSSSRYQQRIAAVKVAAAAANVASKAAHLAQLRTLVSEGAVRAPFDGTVVARYADVGSLIHKGAPIVRMIESGELRVRFAIPEESANAVATGDAVRIDAGELALGGVVEKVNPEIEAASRMVFAEASLEVPPPARGHIRSGQVARVHGEADVARAQ
jgi:RND family efflux transporter MFP subunit